MFPLVSSILVVDDFPSLRTLMVKCLNELGFLNIQEAKNGSDAFQKISDSSNHFDLVLSDWNMPESTGMDLLKRLRADSKFKSLPFIMVTTVNEKEQILEAISLGVIGYIVKPYNTKSVEEKLKLAFTKIKKT